MFFILTLAGCGAPDDNLLVTHTPIPTPSAIEEMPLYLYLQQHRGDLSAASNDPTPIPFSIAIGDLPIDIAARLERAGLIKNADTNRSTPDSPLFWWTMSWLWTQGPLPRASHLPSRRR